MTNIDKHFKEHGNKSISIRNKQGYVHNVLRGLIEQVRAANKLDTQAVNRMMSAIRAGHAIPSDYVVQSTNEKRSHPTVGEYNIITYRMSKEPAV